MDTRSVVLSRLQRGGVPCACDQRMEQYFGIAAIDMVTMIDFGKMVCYKNGRVTACRLDHVVEHLKYIDIKTLYDAERYNGCRTILPSDFAKQKRSDIGECKTGPR